MTTGQTQYKYSLRHLHDSLRETFTRFCEILLRILPSIKCGFTKFKQLRNSKPTPKFVGLRDENPKDSYLSVYHNDFKATLLALKKETLDVRFTDHKSFLK